MLVDLHMTSWSRAVGHNQNNKKQAGERQIPVRVDLVRRKISMTHYFNQKAGYRNRAASLPQRPTQTT